MSSLSAFGVFWIGEGLGVPWPGKDFALLGFAALFLFVSLGATSGALLGLFVEDGGLALLTLVIIAVAGLIAVLLPGMPRATGTVLLLGCPGALFVTVMKAAR